MVAAHASIVCVNLFWELISVVSIGICRFCIVIETIVVLCGFFAVLEGL